MGYLKLLDAGAHSVGLNTTNQIVSATPEFVLTTPLEFTVSGGTAASPQLQYTQAGLISADTELWLKHAGSAALTKVTVGGVSEGSGSVSWGSRIPAADITLTASADYGGAYAASMVLDADYATFWATNTSGDERPWLLRFLLSTAQKVGKYQIAPRGGAIDQCPAAWTFQASNDGSTWTTLDTRSGLTSGWAASTMREFECATQPTQTYLYYRLNITALVAGGTNNCQVAEVALLPFTVATIYTLSSLIPAQSNLPEKAFEIRSDSTKALMALAAGVTDQTFSTSDFTIPVAISSVTYATGPELTVTGDETEITGATTKRLALKLRSDVTATTQRARAAKIYTKELVA